MNKIRLNLRARGNETMIILVLRDFPIEKRLLQISYRFSQIILGDKNQKAMKWQNINMFKYLTRDANWKDQ